MLLVQPVTITFTGLTNVSGGNTNLLVRGADAFRAFPLTTCMNNMNLTINNTQSNVTLKDFIQAAMRFHTPGCLLQTEYSMTPCTLDCYQNYSDGYGSNRNPLCNYADNSYLYGRASFPFDSIVQTQSANTTTPTTSVITATLAEEIFVPPCLFGGETGHGLIGVSTFQVTIQWADLTRLWSHDPVNGNTITNISVTLRQPIISVFQLQPQDIQLIPPISVYPYYELLNMSTNVGTAINATQTMTTLGNNVQLQTVPNKVFIYAKKQNSQITFTDTDTFASISKISISFNGVNGLLSEATQRDLYRMSVESGSTQS